MTALLNTQRQRTVLLTDGDPENRTYLRQELEAQNFTVLEADDARETIELLATQPVGAVVLDLELSARQRAALMSEILSEKCGAPLVFMLISPSVLSREEAYDLGAAGAMSKPIDPAYLIARLSLLLTPTANRLKRALAPERKRHTVEASVFKAQLGRGGFALSDLQQNDLLEGESIEFKVEVKDAERWTLSGTGIVRYVNLDAKSRRQRGWGIEFESLDESSLNRINANLDAGPRTAYIPRYVS